MTATDRSTIAILHAFSRKNAGDGLLVDLTLRLLEEAGVARRDCRVLALDPASFSDLDDVRAVPGEPRGARPSRKLAGAALELARAGAAELPVVRTRAHGGAIGRLLDDVRGVVAVGGGYLVADSTVRQGGVMLNHMPQLLAAGRLSSRDDRAERARVPSMRVPSIYLPQSIGPLRGAAGALARRALSRIDVIYARDDETFAELRGLTDVRRCPDLAVLELASSLRSIKQPVSANGNTASTLIVPRALPNAPGYHDLLRALGSAVPSPRWAVQADVDGPRSDRRFLGTLGVRDDGDLATLLARETPGVVVSVRLHGAIASLLAGWPAIHLSYERKGWGAYQDLGLDEWVHDARRFDVDTVRAQVAELHANPRKLFARIEERLPALLSARRDLVHELATRLAPTRPAR